MAAEGLPFMNIFKGLDHQVKIWRSQEPRVSPKPKRPEGMSGRQWKIARREARKKTA
jgi:hypothetical protein